MVSLATVTTRIEDLYTTKLATGTAVPAILIDLSTVTTALDLKVSLAGSETITGAKDFRTISSSLTVQGSAFSVNGTDFSISASTIQAFLGKLVGFTGGGHAGPNLRIMGTGSCAALSNGGLKICGNGVDIGDGLLVFEDTKSGGGIYQLGEQSTAGTWDICAGGGIPTPNCQLRGRSRDTENKVGLLTGGNDIGGTLEVRASKVQATYPVLLVSSANASAMFSVKANGVVTVSSAIVMGVSVSTEAAGLAGVAVTALCPAGKYAMGGGCNCTEGTAPTDWRNEPNCLTAGCIPTGWTCQKNGSTGGLCAARAVCSFGQ